MSGFNTLAEAEDFASNRRMQALDRLRSASEDAKRVAERIKEDMGKKIGHIQNGLHTTGFDHQRPFDLCAALERRDQAIHWALSLGCTSGDVVEASKGGRGF